MCEYCGDSPCPPGCPNFEEPKGIAECKECDRQISENENHYDIPGVGIYCTDCMYDFLVLGGR